MADPFVGEIRMFGGNFAPQGWALCNGQIIQIDQNEALFSLIGTTYGGDGQQTFALPNLQGRLPQHQGPGFVLGQAAGEEQVTLTVGQLPVHSHGFVATTNDGTAASPPGNVPAATTQGNAYLQAAATTALADGSIGPDPGGGQPHTNMQPYLCISFIISLFGIYPSQS
jgi:microcystin-dependent protein